MERLLPIRPWGRDGWTGGYFSGIPRSALARICVAAARTSGCFREEGWESTCSASVLPLPASSPPTPSTQPLFLPCSRASGSVTWARSIRSQVFADGEGGE